MTRISYLDLDEMTTRASELTQERGNLNVYRALANAQNVFTGWMEAGREALASTALSPRLRELVILRVAHLMNCPYELAQHTDLAHRTGITQADIDAVLSELGWLNGSLDTVEQDVVQLVTDLLTTRRVVGTLFDRVHNALGTMETVEMLMVINRWSGLALMLNALDVDIDDSARISIPSDRGAVRANTGWGG